MKPAIKEKNAIVVITLRPRSGADPGESVRVYESCCKSVLPVPGEYL